MRKPRATLLRIIAILGVASLLASAMWMLLGDRFEVVRSVGPDTFSKSALGHQALKELLEKRGDQVHISRFNSAMKGRSSSLLVIAEPFLHKDETKRLSDFQNMKEQANAVLIILPKRWGVPDDDNPEFVKTTDLHPFEDVQYILSQVNDENTVLIRTNQDLEPNDFTIDGLTFAPTIESAQLLDIVGATPIVDANDGAWVYDISTESTKITLVSDPDVFATHGLDNRNNAQAALEIIDIARSGPGPIIFDETLHGHERRPSLGRTLTEFPLALLTMQFLLLTILALWTAVIRFGPPRPVQLGLARGKSLAIENTAELLDYGGYANHTTERYVWLTVRLVAQRLHVPPSLDKKDLVRRLEEIGTSRAVTIDLQRTINDAENLTLGESRKPRRRALLNIAQRIHEWKQQILK